MAYRRRHRELQGTSLTGAGPPRHLPTGEPNARPSPFRSLTRLTSVKGSPCCFRRRSCSWAPRWPWAKHRVNPPQPTRRDLRTPAAPSRHERRFIAGPAQGARSHHQGYPAQQSRNHAGGAERARSQDGQDPGRAHGRGHQGERGGTLPAGRLARRRQRQGRRPVIEFFDYNCGYCKKALGEVAQLIDKDKKSS